MAEEAGGTSDEAVEVAHLETDPNLAALRDQPAYKALVGRLKALQPPPKSHSES